MRRGNALRDPSSALVYVLAGSENSLKQLRLKKIKATESLPTGEWTDWVPLAMIPLISHLAEAAPPTSWSLISSVQNVVHLLFSSAYSVSHEDLSTRNIKVIILMK